jgi:surfactin synthase thioesterase subunit
MAFRPVDDWFLADDDPDVASTPVRVICFPHAGGDPVSFLRWQRHLADVAQLLAVIPPGRGHRAGQPAVADLAELADRAAAAIAALPERRTVLFGHSLGGLTAFEIARRLRNHAGLTDLIASGCSAPSRMPTARVVEAARLEGREFAEAVAFFGGLPPEVVAAEELHDLLLPRLMADFRMVASYRYYAEPPLQIPVHLINGIDDPHVQGAAFTGWEAESVLPSERHSTAGGHFYFEPDPSFLVSLLRRVAVMPPAEVSQHVELI